MTRALIADASRVTPGEFVGHVFGISPEQREEQRQQLYRQCIAAIESGDTYGWPPLLVAECRELMSAEQLTEVQADPFKARRAA